jgi:hypothetical protein
MVKHPKEFFMCKCNERSGFWDIGDRKVSLMFGAIQTLHLIFQHPPPPPTPKWPKHDSHATGQHLSGTHSLQAKACTTELPPEQALCSCMQLRLLQVLFIFSRSHQISKHAKILKKQHHKPLQCLQFVLHGLAYLLSTSRTWHYIQQTHSEGLWSITKLKLHTSAVSHTFPLPYVSV